MKGFVYGSFGLFLEAIKKIPLSYTMQRILERVDVAVETLHHMN